MAKTIAERIEQAELIRDALLDRMAGRSVENHNSFSVGDRSISKMTMEELQIAYNRMDREVQRLERKQRIAGGKRGHIRFTF